MRLDYIDQLKGFAIFLVVMGHISLFDLNLGSEKSFLFRFCDSLEMPLFTFLSGLMFRKVADLGMMWQKFGKQCRKLLLPFLVVGLSFSYAIGSGGAKFFLSSSKLGYWYLFFLVQCYFLTYVFEIINNAVLKNRRKIFAELGWGLIWTVVFLSIDHLNYIMDKFDLENLSKLSFLSIKIRDLLGIPNLFFYYMFFIIGYVIRKYEKFEVIMKKQKLCKFLGLVYIILFVVSYKYSLFSKFHIPALFGIFYITYYFYNSRNKEDVIKARFLVWGKSSLQIYIFHYFMIWWSEMPSLGIFFANHRADFLQLVFEMVLATIICQICIYVDKLLKIGKY